MKQYITELVICTIVSTIVTLLFYLLGMDKTWEDASTTFGTCFLVMFVLGLWNRLKNNRKDK